VCKSCHARLTKLDHSRIKSDNISDKIFQMLIS
jgi:uncharacterized protein YlaI